MQQFNYHFLKHLSPALDTKLKGATLISCFSQNKNELILEFLQQDIPFYIKAILDGEVSLICFPEQYARAKKNSVDLFPQVFNRKVEKIEQFENERAFAIHLTQDFSLLFKLHGKLANVVFFNKQKATALFKSSLPNDLNIQLSELHRPIDQSVEAIKTSSYDLKSIFPTFDKHIHRTINNLGFQEANEERKEEILSSISAQLNQRLFYITFSPTCLWLIKPDSAYDDFQDPILASNVYANSFLSTYHLDRDKRVILGKVRSEIKKSKSYITKSKAKLSEIQHGRSYEELANIIMANLHMQVETGTKKIKLLDFYNNEEIEIKLNPRVSLQANAEVYYRKSKNQKIEIDQLQTNIDSKEAKLLELQSKLENVENVTSHKELKPYLSYQKQKDQGTKKNLPYTSVTIDGYEVRIGKNAKANDELTLKLSQKNDLWLHARDVAGSHVVIKSINNQDQYPDPVIEKAAQLAAWHSKRKSDTLCPVIYTLKKYITKSKGAPAGAVKVNQEKVVLVEPARSV